MNILKINLYKKNNIIDTNNIPGSKSYLNRILLLIYLLLNVKQIIIIDNYISINDIKYMLINTNKLGLKFKTKNKKILIIKKQMEINSNYYYFENAGTVLRPMIIILSIISNINIIIDGNKNMKKRTIKILVDIFTNNNIKIIYLKNKGFIPLLLKKQFRKIKNNINIYGGISGQFITSCLLIYIFVKKKVYIQTYDISSFSYIKLTLKILKLFKIFIKYKNTNKQTIFVNTLASNKLNRYIKTETDISSLSYFLILSYLKKKNTIIKNIEYNYLQYDINIINIFKRLGLKYKIRKKKLNITYKNYSIKSLTINCLNIPDTSMIFSILTFFNIKNIKLFNIRSWNFKETNRIKSISNEIKKLGGIVYYKRNWIYIKYNKIRTNIIINTYNDHRIAMCFSMLFIYNKNISITNPKCVRKTFPNFFKIIKK